MVEIEIIVRYVEIDRMGIVYYLNYFVWFEAVCIEFIKKVGVFYFQIENEFGVYLLFVNCFCDFKRVCFYEDKILVIVRVNNLIFMRIKFYYEVKRDGVLCVIGFIEYVFVDKNFKLINFEKKNKELFLNFERFWVEDKL